LGAYVCVHADAFVSVRVNDGSAFLHVHVCVCMCVSRMARYLVPRPRGAAYEDYERNVRRPIQLRVVNFLKQWAERPGSELGAASGSSSSSGGGSSSGSGSGDSRLSVVGNRMVAFARTIVAEDEPKLARQLLTSLGRLVRAPPSSP
jgi:hypothetical protein